ncbi:MAG: VWA domain-containing protein [Akkermansia sp.]|nr:VWA domain-containing protein [Akkermansia sp.]
MAIHVRRKGKLLAERRKRMIISSLLSALTVLVLGGIIMYFVVIFFAKEEPAEFITYTPPPNNSDVPKPPTEEEMSSRAAAPSPEINPAVIVSTGVSAVVMAQVDVDVPDFGVGNGLGEGDGMGFDGSGFGHGTGKGNGKGDGGGKGLNDDVQVVLCLDASGSMDQLFVEVADSLNMLVNTMTRCRLNGKKARVNLGIVVYGQAMDNGAPRVLTPFTTDVKSMRSKLKEIQCDGAVEPCGEVIDFALDNFEWNMRDRQDILKIIFIAGNEDFKQGSLDYRTAMHKAKRKNIIVNTIYCYPGMEEEALMTPEGKEWADAATYADGLGLVITMDGSTPAGSPDDAKLHAAAKALWDVPVMAMGGPDAQVRCMKEYADRPAMPKKQGEINDWLAENSELLMRSYDWDLVELCRRYEDEFSLEVIGGPGNLPKELRGLSNSEAVSRLQDAAEARGKALRNYMNAAGAGSGFCGKALRALRIQAQEKGIELKS